MNSKKNTGIFLVPFFLICFALSVAAWQFFKPKIDYPPPSTNVATVLKPARPITDFNLLDTNGDHFTAESLHGNWTLIFFGYTLCPDICPKTLGLVRETWNLFNASQQNIPVSFVFADISLRPASVTNLKEFLQNYRPEFIGITGSPAAMHMLSDQLGIYADQQQNRIDHTAALMLIDKQGRLTAVFTPPFTATDLLHDLKMLTAHQ